MQLSRNSTQALKKFWTFYEQVSSKIFYYDLAKIIGKRNCCPRPSESLLENIGKRISNHYWNIYCWKFDRRREEKSQAALKWQAKIPPRNQLFKKDTKSYTILRTLINYNQIQSQEDSFFHVNFLWIKMGTFCSKS